jgi:hypothetical protein
MLRNDIVLEIRRRLGEDTADFWQDTDIYRALTMGVIHIAREEPWPWLLTEGTESVGTADTIVNLPADVDFARGFTVKVTANGTSSIVQRVQPEEGFRLSTRYTSSGRPEYYYLKTVTQAATTQTTVIKVFPTPDTTYSVDFLYLRRPTFDASSNTEPDIPEDLQPALIAWATAQLWLHEGPSTGADIKAAEQLSIYETYINKARRDMYKLAPDESLVWGREADEHTRAGLPFGFRLPDGYGVPGGWF